MNAEKEQTSKDTQKNNNIQKNNIFGNTFRIIIIIYLYIFFQLTDDKSN